MRGIDSCLVAAQQAVVTPGKREVKTDYEAMVDRDLHPIDDVLG
jgi:hypothetical protein